MSNILSAREHFKSIVAKIDGCLRDEITDEKLDAIITKNLKNIHEDEHKIMFGSLIILDDQLQEKSKPEDLINAMNQILQHMVDFFKLLAPSVQSPDENNEETQKNDEIQEVNVGPEQQVHAHEQYGQGEEVQDPLPYLPTAMGDATDAEEGLNPSGKKKTDKKKHK
jgi:hypothetical protein